MMNSFTLFTPVRWYSSFIKYIWNNIISNRYNNMRIMIRTKFVIDIDYLPVLLQNIQKLITNINIQVKRYP